MHVLGPAWLSKVHSDPGLRSETIVRVTFDGKGGATAVQRWNIGKRVRDVEEAPDGTLWMLEDAKGGGLYHFTPK